MRGKKDFLHKKLKFFGLVSALCLGGALLVFGGIKIFAEILENDVRVKENDILTYYITVNGDGIDYSETESSATQTADETTGITTVTDVLPDGLTFEGFVSSEDGTFGAVQRDNSAIQCSGLVIDDTNEESLTEGRWNATNTEYTYHGLHYDANSRTVTFRTKAIGAGCDLTVGVITRTPTLPEGVFRMDFYDHATYVDESLMGDSNEVHAYIQKDTLPGEFSLSYRYEGNVPQGAPALPQTSYYDSQNASITVADLPTMDGYTFDGWYYDAGGYYHRSANSLTSLPGDSLELYGSWSSGNGEPIPTPEAPEKYTVSYEVDGEKPSSFKVPTRRSYYEGATVELDNTNAKDDVIEGYDFSGWDTEDANLDDETFVMPKRNVVLRGSFEQQTYTVSYEFVGDVLPENASSLLPATTEHHVGDMISLADAPVAEGYVFSGWYSDPNFEMPQGDVVIRGEWTKNKTEFTPEIAIEITNPEEEYFKGDTVNFKVTVTNDQSFALNHVWLQELLSGAVFTEGDGYTVSENSFAEIATIPANSSAIVYAKYDVTKNVEKVYTNEVELIAAEIDSTDYILPDNWDNSASVDFKTGVIPGEPTDEDDDKPSDEKNAKTYDGLGKMVISGMTLGGGLAACILLTRRVRRGGALYGYCAAIMAASGLTVVLINGGFSFADGLTEKNEIVLQSSQAEYGHAGSWQVTESASWTGVGEATLTFNVDTVKISDLHNKDVVLILDNSNWTASAINGTQSDGPEDPPTLDIMKSGARELVSQLLEHGDSRVIVYTTWGTIDSELTSDEDNAFAQIDSIRTSGYSNAGSYSESYGKVLRFLDTYEQSEDRALNIVYVSDDHVANSGDIAKYKMIKAKAPNAVISGIGIGCREVGLEWYTSMAQASASGVARWWQGNDGNIRSAYEYTETIDGLEKISDYHETPWSGSYTYALIRSVDTSLMYDKFNLATTINTADFDIRGIYGDYGDIDIDGDVITWTNEDDDSFVSGAKYKMSVLVKAKDESVELHKLYKVNNGVTIETDASDIAADSATSSESIVLMNGYQLDYAINNPSTCSIGNNESGVYLAWQQIDFDEENVSCEGWNFDTFKNVSDGNIFSRMVNDKMPSSDTTLNATWYKVGAEVHMDGEVYSTASALLLDGINFSRRMNAIGQNSSTLILKADGCPANRQNDNNVITLENSPFKVYAWRSSNYSYIYINSETGASGYYYSNPVYYCTDAPKIVMNEDSSFMFANGYIRDDNGDYPKDPNGYSMSISNYSNFRMVDESIGEWDASNVKNMSYMFNDSRMGLKGLENMNGWDTSNVENMNYFMNGMGRYSNYDNSTAPNTVAFTNWDTSSVKTMRHIFDNSWLALDKLPGLGTWGVSKVKDMRYAFSGSTVNSLAAFAGWNPSGAENMSYMFTSLRDYSYSGTPYDFGFVSEWDTGSAKDMQGIFQSAKLADMNVLSGWDVSSVENFKDSFNGARFVSDGVEGSLGALASWDVSGAKNMNAMFQSSNITSLSPLSAWGNKVSNVEDFGGIFASLDIASLDGLQTWNVSSAKSLNGLISNDENITSLSEIGSWNVSNVESLASAFRGTSVENFNPIKNWDVSSVTDISYMLCGAPQPMSPTSQYTNSCDYDNTVEETGNPSYSRGNYGGPQSLAGLEGWATKTGNVVDMQGLLAGGIITDLSPLKDWNVTGVENMERAFMYVDVEDFSDLSKWKTKSLTRLRSTFAFSHAQSMHGVEGWDTSKVTMMDYAFSHMSELNDISALLDWNTSSVNDMRYAFFFHKNLTSLHGLENWDVSNVDSFKAMFVGYSTYGPNRAENWTNYCNNSLTNISALSEWKFEKTYTNFEMILACNDKLADLTPLNKWRVHNVSTMDSILEGDKSVTSLDGLQNWYADADEKLSKKQSLSFNESFRYMTGLQNISALSGWTASKISVYRANSFFRNDPNIQSLTPLEDTFFSTVSYKSSMANAFDGLSNSIARPNWYINLPN